MDTRDEDGAEARRKRFEDMAGELAATLPPKRIAPAALLRDHVDAGLLAELAEGLGREPDPEEAAAWATMSQANRETTLRRIRVLQRWVRDRDNMTAASAAKEAELGLSRWYDVAARWSSGQRRLFDIGRYARGHPDRKSVFDPGLLNELQAAVPRVVAENDAGDGRPVPLVRMVEMLVQSVDARGRRLPVFNTLREMIERERRRVGTRRQVGTQPGFDMIGSGLLRADGRQHLIYGVIDRTSRLILGHAIGFIEDSAEGHGVAAIDALAGIASIEFEGAPWAGATERIDVVPGADASAWGLDGHKEIAPVECGIADGKKSRGGYFRKAIGPQLGRLKLSSVRNAIETKEVAPGTEIFDHETASLRIGIEVAAHNVAVMTELREMGIVGEPAPPPTLEAALTWVAGVEFEP